MIGVIANRKEEGTVKEFFELFKTPWEFYEADHFYDVVVSTGSEISKINSKLVIIYLSRKGNLESVQGIRVKSGGRKGTVVGNDVEIPIYGNLFTFEGTGQEILRIKGSLAVVGIEKTNSKRKIIFFGYNLFEEMYYLISEGQPKENAQIPTIEMHISLLRATILKAGIPLVEVPPMPEGYDFIGCLSHDIDFWGIRRHRFDHTMVGFLYRASVGSLLRFLKGKFPFRKLMENWKAVLGLPLVLAGLKRDFWCQIVEYSRLEKDLKATFFLIPFKDREGECVPGRGHERRAAKYDISEVVEETVALMGNGFEIGVHGIDAWHDVEKARKELERIAEYSRGAEMGVRIHWLLFNKDSYRILDEAGFSYDSSCGYNESVGYRAGATQVFKPLSAKHLLELPLHIQDTALFYPRRMNLSEKEAMDLCDKLILNAKGYGGVLTVLWHDRSLGPERLWGDFYDNLLRRMHENKVWFATGGEIVKWFRKRRGLMFKEFKIEGDKAKIILTTEGDDEGADGVPSMLLRVYPARNADSENGGFSDYKDRFVDVPWKGEKTMVIDLARPIS